MNLLEVDAVDKAFGGLRALRGVSLTVREGQIVGVLGPNGAGKTTLFGCVSGFHRPDRGAIRVRGHRVDGLPAHRICQSGVGRTFQIVRPFQGMQVIENVMVGAMLRRPDPRQARRAAEAVLERLGLAHLASRAATSLGVADLRAMEVARALATEPSLLLLDEMLAGLTAVEAQTMHDRFVKLRDEGLGLLVIEHSVPTMRALCEHVLVLNFGEPLAVGTPDEVLANPRVQEAWLGQIDE
jgi:branched-chain amino acid transport system ATP-binding protein